MNKIKSITTSHSGNIIMTFKPSNVTPDTYKTIIYDGDFEDFFKDLLSEKLKFEKKNIQVEHEAFLLSLVHLKNNGLSPQDLLKTNFTCDNYKKAFEVFTKARQAERNKKKYFIQIDGREFFCWNEYGYKYSAGGQKEARNYIDLLLAKANYENVNYELAEN